MPLKFIRQTEAKCTVLDVIDIAISSRYITQAREVANIYFKLTESNTSTYVQTEFNVFKVIFLNYIVN